MLTMGRHASPVASRHIKLLVIVMYRIIEQPVSLKVSVSAQRQWTEVGCGICHIYDMEKMNLLNKVRISSIPDAGSLVICDLRGVVDHIKL
jgi:hypothetical protein